MIKENVLEVRRRIEAACLRAKRDPETVKLVAVSKGRSIEQIKEAHLAGIVDFGENKVQEALLKYGEKLAVKWQMVGHLQTNKAKEAVKIFELIHSVDSLRLAEEIDKQAAKINKIQNILIEVKTSPEATKFGIEPEEVFDFIKIAQQLENIAIKGLMTIAPIVNNPEESRPYFRKLKELKDKIDQAPSTLPDRQAGKHLAPILSMGMTDDFEIAVEEGSEIVRIGRAIFSACLSTDR